MADTPSGKAILIPQLTATMEEGLLVAWTKSVGDEIKRGDVVAEVETDKAVMDVEAFNNGFLSGPLVEEGETVPVGTTIGWIVKSEDDVREGTTSAADAGGSTETPEPAADDDGSDEDGDETEGGEQGDRRPPPGREAPAP